MTTLNTPSLKILLLGHPGAGKTTSLASLLSEGYKVRMLDFDHGSSGLRSLLASPKGRYDKESLSRLSVIKLTDGTRPLPTGRLVPRSGTAWTKAMNSLENWIDDDGNKYGKAWSWEKDTVLVIDSLTGATTAAKNFHLAANGWLTEDRTGNKELKDINVAQKYVHGLMDMIRDPSLKCHVIIMCHVAFTKPDGTRMTQDEMALPDAQKPKLVALPKSIGSAISTAIPGYFVDMLAIERSGPSRRIYTVTTTDARFNLKSSAPLNVKDNYDATKGLADYFRDVGAEHE